jgi:predicted  nucleic acid-binding Zn-ribbon protein
MKPETILTGLEKLYAKRKNLDAQISAAEKKLVGEVKNAAKTAGAVKGKVAALKKSVGRPAKKAKSLIGK